MLRRELHPGLDTIASALTATYVIDFGGAAPTAQLPVTWAANTNVYLDRVINGSTAALTVPAGIDSFKISINIADDKGHSAIVQNGPTLGLNQTFDVFGGHAPKKTALFQDNHGRSNSIIEGGNPEAGADLDILLTEWRKQGVVGGNLTLPIGMRQEAGDQGEFNTAVVALPTYQVSYYAAFDDGTSATGSFTEFDATTMEQTLMSGGTNWSKTTLHLPTATATVQLAFEVKRS